MSELLTALAGWQRCIICELVPRDGRLDKVPIDPLTRYSSNAQDPATWLLPSVAADHVQRLGNRYCVGLVIAPPFFCIDLDHHLITDAAGAGIGWSAHAVAMCQRFAGCAVEVSISGHGLHIFGTYIGAIDPHRTKNRTLSMECYTRFRFICLTGVGECGSILTDATDALLATIAEYFAGPVASIDGDWTDAPVSDWRGPTDDDELIALMLRAAPRASQAFGGKATFRQLWEGDANALAVAFPSWSPGKPFDQSGADIALANALAFYTGSDCERMRRLMDRSGLKRDKWNRADYIPMTVTKAASECRTWYKSPARTPTDTQGGEVALLGSVAACQPAPTIAKAVDSDRVPVPPPPPARERPPPGTYLTTTEQLAEFDGYTYIEDIHAILDPQGATVTPERFNVRWGGYLFQTTADGQRPSKSAWDAFTANETYRFPRADGLVFEPRSAPLARIERDGRILINSYSPLSIAAAPGDVTPFLAHLSRLFPHGQDAEILLAYFAFMVQHKGVKAKWAPLIQGVEGNGKSFLSDVMAYCIGLQYTHSCRASQIDSQFNSALDRKLLVIVEDIKVSEHAGSVWEALKPMIERPRIEIEAKGVDKVMRDVCFNFIFNSNHRDAIRKTANDRRIAPFFAAQQSAADLIREGMTNADGHTSDYFDTLFNWFNRGGNAHIADYLAHYAIPDELNPATKCIRAPVTASTAIAISVGAGTVEQEIAEAIDSGREGFRNGWANTFILDILLSSLGKARAFPRGKRVELLESLGYMTHPGLLHGRPLAALPNGTRPQLFVKAGHDSMALTGAAVVNAYLKDQAAS